MFSLRHRVKSTGANLLELSLSSRATIGRTHDRTILGVKVFEETIDQLLGYSSWRDTKTAILVFNKNKDTSKVLETIKAATEAHANYKRMADWRHDSGYRFVMHHPSDKNRELLMTVLVFDIPESETKPATTKRSTRKMTSKD